MTLRLNAGLELRIDVDGDLRWSRCYGWTTRELDTEAENKRHALRERGWTDQRLTQLEQCGRTGTDTRRLT